MPIDDLFLFGPNITPREDQGVEFPWEQSDAILIDLTPVAFPYYINMCPLVTRLRQVPARQVEYKSVGHAQRPNAFLLMASATATGTTLTPNDASIFMNGDVIELPTGEHCEVAADPDTVANTITVTRAMEGTTGTAVTVVTGSEPQCYLIGNTRTGGEEFQRGIFPKTWLQSNWIQTSQHPVEISGLFQDTANWLNAEMAPTPLDMGRMRQLKNLMEGYERAFLYGLGAAPTAESTKRAKTRGILKRLSDVGNVVTPNSSDKAAYTPEMLFRDLWSNINGYQNLLMLSPDWRGALVTWKVGVSLILQDQTNFNMNIETFEIPSFGAQAVVFNPQMRKGTALALREEDLSLRYMRMPSWYPRGKNGDAWKGDLIARMGIQVDNPELQSAVVGVTGFGKP